MSRSKFKLQTQEKLAPLRGIHDLSDRNAIVTGGTSGVGKAIAFALANFGIQTTIIGCDPRKGLIARDEIRELAGHDRVHYLRADLSLMQETEQLAAEISARHGLLHYLVHSAATMRRHWEQTRESIESNFAVNYLSRFVLTQRLLPLLRSTGRPGKASRIVLMGGAARGAMYFEDLNLTQNFSLLRAVRQFCRANDLFAAEFARREAVLEGDPRVNIVSLKLAMFNTNVRRELSWWLKLAGSLFLDYGLGKPPQQVADSAIELLLAPEFEGVTGTLYSDVCKLRRIAPDFDSAEAVKLWMLSEWLLIERSVVQEDARTAIARLPMKFSRTEPCSGG